MLPKTIIMAAIGLALNTVFNPANFSENIASSQLKI
jgi:hypothetical protein